MRSQYEPGAGPRRAVTWSEYQPVCVRAVAASARARRAGGPSARRGSQSLAPASESSPGLQSIERDVDVRRRAASTTREPLAALELDPVDVVRVVPVVDRGADARLLADGPCGRVADVVVGLEAVPAGTRRVRSASHGRADVELAPAATARRGRPSTRRSRWPGVASSALRSISVETWSGSARAASRTAAPRPRSPAEPRTTCRRRVPVLLRRRSSSSPARRSSSTCAVIGRGNSERCPRPARSGRRRPSSRFENEETSPRAVVRPDAEHVRQRGRVARVAPRLARRVVLLPTAATTSAPCADA